MTLKDIEEASKPSKLQKAVAAALTATKLQSSLPTWAQTHGASSVSPTAPELVIKNIEERDRATASRELRRSAIKDRVRVKDPALAAWLEYDRKVAENHKARVQWARQHAFY